MAEKGKSGTGQREAGTRGGLSGSPRGWDPLEAATAGEVWAAGVHANTEALLKTHLQLTESVFHYDEVETIIFAERAASK